jgi:large subunit ribosomal protein L23
MNTIVIRPRVSEKSYGISNRGVYVFDVSTNANKLEIAKAIESAYDVKTTSVRTSTVKGKTKRFYRAGKFENGKRSNFKKAYVTLAEGTTLPIFEAVDEQATEISKDSKKTIEQPKAKRGIFNRSKKAMTSTTTVAPVKRTQAKVGEK